MIVITVVHLLPRLTAQIGRVVVSIAAYRVLLHQPGEAMQTLIPAAPFTITLFTVSPFAFHFTGPLYRTTLNFSLAG